MRFAYGIHGYGRGHAMRALAVLPELVRRHEVLILAGGDAYRALADTYPVVHIPTLRFYYSRRGKLSNVQTMRRNVSAVLDAKLGGPAVGMVADELSDFKPDVVVSDSELFSLHAARMVDIPTISFDRFGMLVYCRAEIPTRDILSHWRDSFVYRRLYGRPDRVVVSSFFTAEPRKPGVRVVGSVIRSEVCSVTPSRGEYLLAYFSNGDSEFTPDVERALTDCSFPCRIYGTRRRGLQENLLFKPIANVPFLEDLAGCRAVIATTGNQLLGEVLHFRKPILGLPHDCFEQRINARQIEKMGIGQQMSRRQLTARHIRAFLDRVEEFEVNMPAVRTNGKDEAVEALEELAQELTGVNGGASSPATAGIERR